VENKKVLIVGGGPDGVQAARDQLESGAHVTLLEKFPTLAGEKIPRDRLITPDEAFERTDLDKVGQNPNIDVLTYSEIKRISRDNGHIKARVLKKSTRVDNTKCTECKACIKVCPVNMLDDFSEGVGFRTAVDYCNLTTGEYNIYKEDMPACQQACPVNLDVRSYVGMIADGRYLESLAIIRERLPLPGSIGRICPHPCETACNRQYLDEPISVCFLKRFVADVEIAEGVEPAYDVPEKKFPEKIAVIGAGPSGLTCAYDLARSGYTNITIFETLPVPGGYLWVGIPEYRLPKKLLQREVDLITNMGVEIRYNTRIGKDIAFQDLINDHDAVFLGVGCHTGLKLRIPGEDELDGVVDCVTFLREQALGVRKEGIGKLIVIGGGNAAIDSARVGWRMGFDEVYILYRRTRKEMPANPWEVDAAEHEGVILQYLVAPLEIIGENGKVAGMKCIKMELGEPDASGRRRPVPVEGSEFVIEAQTIVPAISQAPDLAFLPKEHDFNISRWNTFEIDEETGTTNIPGVFAGGDITTGPDIAIRAVAGGKRAAAGIHEYLRSK
jgi:NADPH-dependent glutamate synthase beta subunit-like oxidoreductase/NAD-dependent dihydropyrimidine dehydrogenase PreA subunit